MKKFIFLIVLMIIGVWTYFWAIHGINLITREDGNIGIPPFSISEKIPDDPKLEVGQGYWRQGASMPTSRVWSTAVALNDRIYVMGGMDGFARTLDKVEIYDPSKDSWEIVSSLPEPRHHAASAVVNGKIYVIGGFSGVNSRPHDSVFIFDPESSTWSEGASLPEVVGAAGSSVGQDGVIHLFGGRNIFGPINKHMVYSTTTDSWSEAEEMTQLREGMSVVNYNDRLWVLGGRVGSAAASLGLIEYWKLGNQSWADPSSMPSRRSMFSASVVKNRIYVLGGQAGTSVFGDISVYDYSTRRWLALGIMPTPRHGHAAVVLDDKIFIIGGGQRSGFSVSNLNHIFIP